MTVSHFAALNRNRHRQIMFARDRVPTGQPGGDRIGTRGRSACPPRPARRAEHGNTVTPGIGSDRDRRRRRTRPRRARKPAPVIAPSPPRINAHRHSAATRVRHRPAFHACRDRPRHRTNGCGPDRDCPQPENRDRPPPSPPAHATIPNPALARPTSRQNPPSRESAQKWNIAGTLAGGSQLSSAKSPLRCPMLRQSPHTARGQPAPDRRRRFGT